MFHGFKSVKSSEKSTIDTFTHFWQDSGNKSELMQFCIVAQVRPDTIACHGLQVKLGVLKYRVLEKV